MRSTKDTNFCPFFPDLTHRGGYKSTTSHLHICRNHVQWGGQIGNGGSDPTEVEIGHLGLGMVAVWYIVCMESCRAVIRVQWLQGKAPCVHII